MGRLFGTDGVRGLANADLTPELALSLAEAAARVLPAGGHDGRTRPVAVVGRDTRASGEMLEAAVCAGLTAAGVDAVRVGVVPTPAVAYLTDFYDAAFGVMISASHNPMPDNGIKFFAAGGHKLSDAAEDAIEAAAGAAVVRPTGAAVGRVRDAADGIDAYLDHLSGIVDVNLKPVTVVVDCAHGAAYTAAPRAYRSAGATVIALSADPDGENINLNCGSTHLDQVRAAVLDYGADLGLAHDGDADRCLAVDATGAVVDGDAIMAVLASAMKDAGSLKDDTLVATVMSNLGLHLAMTAAGITVRTTAVGDRYVLEELRAGGFSLGGEQSGHVVIPSHGTTGDGILTGLALMGRMASSGKSLAELASIMNALPQVLINVRVADKNVVAAAGSVQAAVTDAETELGATGRVLLRPSGTEQLVRVMVEAATAEQAQSVAARIAAAVEAA
ncbi:MAG: phosphoglucosamine mutase [Gordonia sp.]|uniref:phosphoglucosamine mutase n=1 Tax=Williamsia sp. 1138 TaxID=1903117 RepID=UPI000A0FAD41|nr:phosphoglucosamine mutase [Williamsia sp. 1138]MBA4022117.1 phosphoglucosamine mutase [Gordonia sp. (in: high G+C Gram-positive bacteria)]OZG27066.1 phosphoglucosamine mutase [Williamsia sp. 1138]